MRTMTNDIVWEQPPAPPVTGDGPTIPEIEEALSARPGEWARVRTCSSQNAASTRIASWRRRPQGGQYEWTTRTITEDDTKVVAIYGRYLGEAP